MEGIQTQILVDIGMLCLILAIIPQLIKTYKNRKNLKDVDFKFSFLTLIGNAFTIVWGVMYYQWSILILNSLYGVWSILTIYWMVRK